MRYVAILIVAIVMAFIVDLMVNADSISGWRPTALVEYVSNKNKANGYAGLDSNGKLNTNVITDVVIVHSGGSAFE